ncbi:MAG: c-type cytochrome [Bacteroidetes bacterium]|nr:c-type cytochrome [Bacteroidota bacterium]
MATTPSRKIKTFLLTITFLLSFLILSVSSVFGADAAKLFKQNCAVCHRLDATKLTGPGLAGIATRVPSEKWLFDWVKNNEKLKKSGDAYATKITAEYGGASMNVMEGVLSDDEIKSVIEYIKNPPVETPAAGVAATSTEGPAVESNPINTLLVLGGIIALLLILAIVLRSTKYNLLNVIAQKKNQPEVSDSGWWGETKIWMNQHKRTVALGIIILLLALSKMAWDGMMNIGVFTGYKPEQPIKFSHKIHAGDNAINCQYCHSSVEKSRHAGIPSPNVCMNCHKGIDKGPITGTAEIAKIYEAIGWDPATQKYDKAPKGIKWVKVHNLQDFVFFSHQQHVKVGKLDCSNCHGDVKTMTVAEQVQPLTMGWCVDCHRKTEVAGMKDNPYYEELHKKLAEKYKGQKITVDKMGGIECAKCHY